MIAAALLCVVVAAEPSVATVAAPHQTEPHQTVVFKSARQALRDEHPEDVLKLWLLRNALVDHGEAPVHDAEFASLVWVSLGIRGLCPDGFPHDDGGAGLWPLAMHNYLLTRLSKREVDRGPSWDAFVVGRQQRRIALSDVLSREELHSVRFDRGFCLGPYVEFLQSGEAVLPDFHDRFVVGTLMYQMLERARATLVKGKVEHTALIDARLFDLDLALAELRARKARERAATIAQLARSVGLPDGTVEDLRKTLAVPSAATDQTAFLRRTLSWSPDEWLTLSSARRLALYKRAHEIDDHPDEHATLVLGIIDGLVDRAARAGGEGKDGAEIEDWIGFLHADSKPPLRNALVLGDRGKRLLALEPQSGFTARGVIALHRAVAFLEEGDIDSALVSLGYALANADDSSAADTTRALALRWLSYLASQYATTPQLVETLHSLASRRDVVRILEDLLWRAALRADLKSFNVVVDRAPRGGSLDDRIELLRVLAQGKLGAFVAALAERSEKEPQAGVQLIQQLITRVESEDIDVRRAQVPTLRLTLDVLRRLGGDDAPLATRKRASALRDRTLAIIDGLGDLNVPVEDLARTLAPEHESFAGGVRLAPSDALPWPFHIPSTESPSAFLPVILVPFERTDAAGVTSTAWTLTE